ncbi:zf-TFIIB domain-containing protein [Ramlibacter sp. AN1015]|uniref:TFIIB-type zinc ribbon-containing protein n=1 Tax=Ramlibacter sp. AN1015 TaxID=3133428 RepID=UPI0030C4405D
MNCPHCGDVTLVMSERQNVEIDYCPQCRGVWLDRGELDKLIERSAAESAPPQPTQAAPAYQPGYSQPPGYASGYQRKKPKSWLSEIFD